MIQFGANDRLRNSGSRTGGLEEAARIARRYAGEVSDAPG